MTTDAPPHPSGASCEADASVAVLPIEVRFGDVDGRLAEAGFALAGSVALGNGGSADRARWTRGHEQVRWFRDLATGLVTIVAPAATDLPLPQMGIGEALDLIDASEPRTILAGLQAAAILRAPALVPPVARRLLDPDPVIARHAAEALFALAGAVAPSGLADLGGALFALPGWRREKLQVMRWLGRDGPAGGEAEGLLARALGDPDWEIRATAMLAAARLGLSALAKPIAAAALPGGPADGLTSREARLLRALRDAALAHLGEPVDRKLPPGVAAAVGGDVADLPPGLDAFAHALIHPLPDHVPPPPAAVPGVIWASDGPHLEDGQLLAWVPSLPHWLGETELRGAEPNPPRRTAPAAGFFIDAEPRGTGSLAEARSAADALARRLGRPVSLVSAETWEMAARGPDGRRFAWGMNARPDARVDLSPWGVAGTASGPGEWVLAGSGEEIGLVAGGRDNPVAARMTKASPSARFNFRFYYPAT